MFSRLGVRGRLLLSFVGISGFAVFAGAAAMYSFEEVKKALDKITEQRIPTALAAQELSAGVERIVAGAPALFDAGTPREHFEIWSKLGQEVGYIETQLRLLESHGIAPDAHLSLKAALDPLRSNLRSLNTLAGARITLADRKAVLLNGLLSADEETQALLGSWVTNVSNDIERLRAVANNVNLSIDKRLTAQADLIGSVTSLTALQDIKQQVIEVQDNFIAMASAEDDQRLNLLTLRARWPMEVLENLATEVGTHPRELVLGEIVRFRRFAEGENSMPSLRMRELKLLAESEEMLRENARLSRELTRSVRSLVQSARQDITQATTQARNVQTASSVTLIVVVTLSVVSSTLIVWLYVGRNIIARLTKLSVCMESVAGGDLKVHLPSDESNDEIGRMTKALTVFRDTAVEIEENNLREIGQARQRLMDAIESISEGFCYFDSNDKLIVANSQYRALMYPGESNAAKEGMTFEQLIRNAAEKGYVKDAENGIDEWVAERLAVHRQPGAPHIQQRANGRWIMVSERKTTDSGTVAIYSDITELKQREEELAEKSRSMEKLSNQIAKYLSPQIYESIFTGKQEVKVASHRRKLTIFFSDIAGFTETAEQLESEDLTKLLNHYLTEMSQIALEYGATIDKYVGDAIVIFFGDPETRGVKEDALACVRMAIAMRQKMAELQGIWRDSGIVSPLRCRIGINTGFCTVGNFGSEDRMDYTIIGSGVNLASRLESAASPGEILIAYETCALVKDEILCEKFGKITVKGISHPIETFRVVDAYENIDRELEVIQDDFPNYNLKIDLGKLSTDERSHVVASLNRALEKLGRHK